MTNTIIFDFGGVLVDWDPHRLYDKHFGSREKADRLDCRLHGHTSRTATSAHNAQRVHCGAPRSTVRRRSTAATRILADQLMRRSVRKSRSTVYASLPQESISARISAISCADSSRRRVKAARKAGTEPPKAPSISCSLLAA